MAIDLGIVGVGGYGGEICREFVQVWDSLPVKVIAAHDPMAAKFPEMVEALKAKGVRFYETYEELLASPIQALWLPVPIDLHRRFTEQALLAGKAVLCEKPAAGSIQDVDGMIQARDAANGGKGGAVAIGYQHMYAPSTYELKRRILSGDIGTLKEGTLLATWQRTSKYYARSWAGALARNGAWLLDSPANNAFAHYVHLLLFLFGPTMETSALPVSIEAELYRANAIENYDTCAFCVKLDSGQALLMCLSHAANVLRQPVLTIYGDKGTLTVDTRERTATVSGGPHPGEIPLSPIPHKATIDGFCAFLAAGADKTKPHGSLECSRMHALVISGASQCTPVVTIQNPETFEVKGETVKHIPGVTALFEQALARRQMPHETGLAVWTCPPGRMDLRGYCRFAGVPDRATAAADKAP